VVGFAFAAEHNVMIKQKISVLLVDDHSLVRRGFRRMLEDESDIDVVGEASSGREAVDLARKLKPQVILMDCALQGESGIAAARNILSILPKTAVLMLSMHSEETLVRQSFEAGARGYILKNASDLDLAAAVRRVLDGDVVLDAQLKRVETLKGERTAGLTARELEVLQLIAVGKSNKEIASDLDLSVNTVAVHRANIMNALGLHKTAELVVYAIRNGLVNLP
jgi:DNA-binding NarL/FixJ family response regulator